MNKIKNQKGIGILAIIIIVIIAALIALFVFTLITDTKQKAKAYHTAMRTKSLQENYDMQCPEMKENNSIADFKYYYERYRKETDNSISFDIADPVFDISEYYDSETSNLKGTNVTYAVQYVSGSAQIGVVFKDIDDSYCVLAQTLYPI